MATKMTVGAALRRCKKLKGEIAELEKRAASSLVWEEGKDPPFNFGSCLGERNDKVDELVRLKEAIALANASTQISVGPRALTAARAVAELAELKSAIAWIGGLPVRDRLTDPVTERLSEWDDVAERNTVRAVTKVFKSAVDKRGQVALVESLKARFEAMNLALEASNHATFVEVE